MSCPHGLFVYCVPVSIRIDWFSISTKGNTIVFFFYEISFDVCFIPFYICALQSQPLWTESKGQTNVFIRRKTLLARFLRPPPVMLVHAICGVLNGNLRCFIGNGMQTIRVHGVTVVNKQRKHNVSMRVLMCGLKVRLKSRCRDLLRSSYGSDAVEDSFVMLFRKSLRVTEIGRRKAYFRVDSARGR